MKYPQLVSPRAVNAISDWLVSRLEQLGVESPQIYTRLLLSLLQSSVQVNDPIEFSNLEAFFANRKGGHKRFHLPSDTETLKKLNAVQCLREIVSNEQETATIEELVDELCEKLKDIERQTQNLSDEERFLIETQLNTDSLIQNQANTQLTQQQQQQHNPSSSSLSSNHPRHHHQTQNHHQHHYPHHNFSQILNNSQNCISNCETKQRNHVAGASTTSSSSSSTATATAEALNDLDNDPKKRYFRAFPALSKEMEDSFRIWRRNAKSLTWPVVGRSIVTDNSSTASASLSSSSASSIISSSNFGANSNSAVVAADKSVEKKLKVENKVVVSAKGTVVGAVGITGSVNSVNNIGGSDVQQQQHQGAVAAVSVKKSKSKRRRNQALCKGKTIQNIRKLSVGTSTSSNSVAANKYHHYTHHRNSSPAWDTDFKGCWEMGPDLIKEFLSRQNGGHKRNRSNSDSMDHEEHNERKILNEMSSSSKNEDRPIMKRYIDLSFCCDDDEEDDEEEENVKHDVQPHKHRECTEEGVDYVDEDYDDSTLATCSELAMDCLNPNPKRLYQREAHGQKSLTFGPAFVFEGDNTLLNESSDFVDPLDFQQFKAKFNSSVEALWKDVEPATQQANSLNLTQNPDSIAMNVNKSLVGGISSAFYATTSLNALAPFKKDLWNFWSNYNEQHFDQMNNNNNNNNVNTKLSTTASSSSMITTTRLDDSSASSGAGADIANSSDYFSMPSNLDDFDKSVGGVRRLTEAGASLGAHTPSINVFLQNSIWSTSGDCVDAIGGSNSAVDTDESFLFKVWHSNKKLSQLDVGSGILEEKLNSLVPDNEDLSNNDFTKPKESSSTSVNNPNLGANLQFPPYQNLKWSEGINAGPPYSSLRSHANANSNELDSASLRTDTNFASFNSVANISGATWEAPAYGQNAQPDLKSWCASNPMSLTEMYGNDVCDSIVNPAADEGGELNSNELSLGPAVTLPNHCANTSGFVAYSRIKQCGLVQPKPLQPSTASRLPKDFFRAGGEEENLLNSERTHFHPIENFVDGHTFDISDALDTIEFERTSSGLMRYDSEEYLEYTRNDIYMADEEVATSSTNFLKYSNKSNEHEEDKNEKFVIKFRVKRSGEMACQTEAEDFQLAAAKMSEMPSTSSLAGPVSFSSPSPLEVTNMFHNTFSLSRQANNEAILAAVTKAVAAAAKAAADNHLNSGHFSWLPNNSNLQTGTETNTTTSSSNTMDTNPLWLNENSLSDEVDFCKIQTGQHQQMAQNWSMQEVEKQCHQRRCLPQQQLEQDIKRKFPSSVDIERHEENSLDTNSLHTLWGMCAVCNSCGEYGKSMPANRLLRDELQLEADEIMSDLRYMQDLYIGESANLNENPGEEDNDLANEDKRYNEKMNQEMEVDSKNPWNMLNKKTATKQHDPAQVSMLQKVNQLIEDLLKPENAGNLLKETEEYDFEYKEKDLKQSWNLTPKEQLNSKNLWQFTEEEEDNIWQHKPLKESLDKKETMEKAESFIKPMKLLKQVGGSLTEDQQYKETLNWEHDNLAKIWQQQTARPKSNSTPVEDLENLESKQKNENLKELIKEDLKQEQDLDARDEVENESPLLLEANQVVEEKNLKNLTQAKGGRLTPTSSMSGNTYKRVQQFLNNSAAKFKINANRKRRHSASQNFYQQQNQHQQHQLQPQNFQQQQHELLYGGNNNFNLMINNNNNNNNNISDLNAYKFKLNETLKLAKEQQQQQQQEQESFTFNNISTKTSASFVDEKPSKQTIITCKYWTTATNGTQTSLDSAAAAMMLLAAASNVNNNSSSNVNNANSMNTNEGFDVEDVMLDENIFGNTFSCLIDKNASILKHMTMMTRPLTR